MTRIDHSEEAGFTLIEVLVALVLAGLGMALLFAASGSGIGNSSAADRQIEAVSLAQSRLSQIGRTMPLKKGDYDGREEGGFSWHAHIGVPASHGNTALFPITVTESWRDGLRQRALSVYSERVGAQ